MADAAAMAKVRADIGRFGWHCLHVYPQQCEMGVGFTYTIGLAETFHKPEIAIFGLDRKTSHAILNDCVELIRRGDTFPMDTLVSEVVAGDVKVQFKRVREDKLDACFGTAIRYYGKRRFDALVLFWPSKAGAFPWESSAESLQAEALTIV